MKLGNYHIDGGAIHRADPARCQYLCGVMPTTRWCINRDKRVIKSVNCRNCLRVMAARGAHKTA